MTSDSLSAGARGNPEEATPGAASVLAPDPPYLWRGPLAVAVDEGQGPLVVLLHGFPELPGSWHNQVGPLVEAGYRVVVPYLRGYGYSPILADPAFSAADRLAGDVVGVIDACGEQQAVVVGHDQGADVAWALARLHPERLRGVVGVSVPFVPRRDRPPYELLREASGDRFNYVLYFQQPGVAEAELNPNVERFLASRYGATSGTPTPGAFPDLPAATGTVLQLLPEPDALPAFVDPAIFAESVGMYTRTRFYGRAQRLPSLRPELDHAAAPFRADRGRPSRLRRGRARSGAGHRAAGVHDAAVRHRSADVPADPRRRPLGAAGSARGDDGYPARVPTRAGREMSRGISRQRAVGPATERRRPRERGAGVSVGKSYGCQFLARRLR